MLKMFARLAIVLVFAFPMNLMAMSENTIALCENEVYYDSVACQLYQSGFSSSSEMACSMCMDIMRCINEYVNGDGGFWGGVTDAIQLCAQRDIGQGDAGMVLDLIANSDIENLDVDLGPGDFMGVCMQYYFCTCWPGTYGDGAGGVCYDCPENGYSDNDATLITECYKPAGSFSDSTGSGQITERCNYSN